MSPLDYVRTYSRAITLVALIVVVGITFFYIQSLKGQLADKNQLISELKQQHAEREAAWQVQARESADAERAKEQARFASVHKELQLEQAKTQTLQRDIAVVRTDRDRMLARAREIAAAATRPDQGSSNPSVAAAGSSTAGPAVVFTDLLERCTSRLQDLVELNQFRKSAGQFCERQYDSLEPPVDQPKEKADVGQD